MYVPRVYIYIYIYIYKIRKIVPFSPLIILPYISMDIYIYIYARTHARTHARTRTRAHAHTQKLSEEVADSKRGNVRAKRVETNQRS